MIATALRRKIWSNRDVLGYVDLVDATEDTATESVDSDLETQAGINENTTGAPSYQRPNSLRTCRIKPQLWASSDKAVGVRASEVGFCMFKRVGAASMSGDEPFV